MKCLSCLECLDAAGFHTQHVPQILAGDDPKQEVKEPAKEEDKLDAAGRGRDQPATAQDLLFSWDDPMDWVKSLSPILEVLPLGSGGRAVPVRCTICRSRSKAQFEGKVFDLTTCTKANLILYYVNQHLKGATHVRNRQTIKPGLKEEQESKPPMECTGLRIFDERVSRVAGYQDEFLLWIAHTPQSQTAKHKYWRDAESRQWYVRHADCKVKDAAGLCEHCRTLGQKQALLKMALRFAFKHAAARLLAARLFGGQEELSNVMNQLKNSNLYARHQVKMDKILALTDADLQALVRACFLHEDSSKSTPVHSAFVDSVVRPSLRVNVSRMGGDFSDLLSRLTSCLASGRLTEMQEINARIAGAALAGRLENHPLIQGLSMSAIRLLEKQDSGLQGLRGRPREVSETEYSLVADAGLSLAIAGGNATLARTFGQRLNVGKVAFDTLHERDLPRPALALRFEGLVKENLDSIDRKLLTRPGTPPRRLFVAFDATYLQPSLTQCTIQGQAALVGGSWQPRGEDQSFYPLEQTFEIHKIEKARQMLLCSSVSCAARSSEGLLE